MECQSCQLAEIYGNKGELESFQMICSGNKSM